MTGIIDVALRAGVAKSTASRALSGNGYVSAETRERVVRAARELAYSAHSSASSLATGRTSTIGVIMPMVDRWFFSEILLGIQHALIANGLDLGLYCAPEGSADRARMLDHALAGRRFDGIIAICLEPGAHELERLAETGLPLVSAGPFPELADTVTIDDVAAARVATEHLIELGHEDIAFLGDERREDLFNYGEGQRHEGYCLAMSAAGLSSRIRAVPTGSSIPESFETVAALLADRRHRPTAIAAVCDEAAIGAILAAQRLGIGVPSELSVIGIDDHRYAEMFSLTTIRQNPREQGAEAVRLLLARMQAPDAPLEHVIAPSTLMARQSTAAPRLAASR